MCVSGPGQQSRLLCVSRFRLVLLVLWRIWLKLWWGLHWMCTGLLVIWCIFFIFGHMISTFIFLSWVEHVCMTHLQLSPLDWLKRCDVRPQGADVLMCWEMGAAWETLSQLGLKHLDSHDISFFLTLKILCRDSSYAVAPGTINPLECSIL